VPPAIWLTAPEALRGDTPASAPSTIYIGLGNRSNNSRASRILGAGTLQVPALALGPWCAWQARAWRCQR